MADKTIPQLTEATAVAASDLLLMDNGTQTYKVQVFTLSAGVVSLPRVEVDVSDSTINVGRALYLADTSTGVMLFKLPDPATLPVGWRFSIKDVGFEASVYTMFLLRFATEQIEGISASYALAADGGSWTFETDGTNWWKV